jgi:hypothetical protein
VRTPRLFLSPALILHFFFPFLFMLSTGFGVSAFLYFGIWLFFLQLSFLLSGFLCLLERSHEARSFANQQARRFTGWDGPTKEKAQLVLEEYCEWEEFHPAFFDEEDISAQETSSMDEGGRNSCIIKGILRGSTA